jgi:uncharacterized OB-fold protein
MEELNVYSCPIDNEAMKLIDRDDEEPLLIYKCPKCGHIQYVPIGGYDG